MSTNTVTSSTSAPEVKQNGRPIPSKDSNLDVNDFLKLLIAQMSNQDPMGGAEGGGSGTDYISQLAQFTMLQQLTTLGTSMASSQAYNLIGKYVFLQERPDSQLIHGKVDGVIKENGINYLMVGGETYDMSKVYAVSDEGQSVESSEEQVLRYAYLIGRQVTAKVPGEDEDDPYTTITGTVEKIKIENGIICLVVDGHDVGLGAITEIAGDESAQDTTNI
jgi:flagellar basal-body rod modification protein FlgD